MFEKKIVTTAKVTLKELSIEDGKIIDADGVEKDLAKIIRNAFGENAVFDFVVTEKTSDSEIIEEDGEESE